MSIEELNYHAYGASLKYPLQLSAHDGFIRVGVSGTIHPSWVNFIECTNLHIAITLKIGYRNTTRPIVIVEHLLSENVIDAIRRFVEINALLNI